MRYYDSFLKGPARANGKAKWGEIRGAKLQYSATITTPTDILFPTTSTPEVLSAPRPGEREKTQGVGVNEEEKKKKRRRDGNLIKNSIRL